MFSVISYGASICGTQEYSCINSVQQRACRFFLGVGKFTPNAGGKEIWVGPQQKCVNGIVLSDSGVA